MQRGAMSGFAAVAARECTLYTTETKQLQGARLTAKRRRRSSFSKGEGISFIKSASCDGDDCVCDGCGGVADVDACLAACHGQTYFSVAEFEGVIGYSESFVAHDDGEGETVGFFPGEILIAPGLGCEDHLIPLFPELHDSLRGGAEHPAGNQFVGSHRRLFKFGVRRSRSVPAGDYLACTHGFGDPEDVSCIVRAAKSVKNETETALFRHKNLVKELKNPAYKASFS